MKGTLLIMNKTKTKQITCMIIFFILIAYTHSFALLYSIDGNGNIDLIENYKTSPIANNICETNMIFGDIAIDPLTGLAYGINTNDYNLYAINLSNCSKTNIGNTGLTENNALDFSIDGELYGLGKSSTKLYKINIETAQTEVFLDTGFTADGDITFDANEILYFSTKGSNFSKLISINLETKEIKEIGSFGINNIYGLDIDQDGSMYAVQHTSTGSAVLYLVNKQSGLATEISTIENENYGNFGMSFTVFPNYINNAPGLYILKQYTGKYGISSDGFGDTSNSGEITAYIPKNSTITSAYLYSVAYTMDEDSVISIEGLKFNSKEITFEKYYKNPWKSVRENYSGYFLTGRSNVTSEIKDIYDSNIENYTFSITESHSEVDGEALVIVYYNNSLPETTIAIIDGGASIIGDQILISFPTPMDPSLSSFFAELYLGISFSCCNQASNIFVNDNLITENAGNHNDGKLMVDNRGSLITVGGHNDTFSPHLPSYDEDTERYDIKQYISSGSSEIKIKTVNTSGDDNLFLVILKVNGSGTVEIPCSDSDNDGVVDQWDSCPNTPLGSIITSFGCPVVLGDISKNDKLGIEDSILILQTLSKSKATKRGPIDNSDSQK